MNYNPKQRHTTSKETKAVFNDIKEAIVAFPNFF